MTETSAPWSGVLTGDCGPYTDQEWADIWDMLFGRLAADAGVLRGVRSELAVTGTGSPVAMAAGGAVVNGTWYSADGAENLAIPTPSSNTRIDRVVLRKDFAAQTVRLTRIAGVEGGGAPSLVQINGVTWDIPLAQASITTGGVITVTDQRIFTTFATRSDVPDLFTAAGQLIYATASRVAAALAAGTNGFVLKMVGGLPAWTNIGVPQVVKKGSDQTVSSNATLFNDSVLFVPIGANESMDFEVVLQHSSANTTPGLKAAITVPAGAALAVSAIGISSAGTIRGTATASGANIFSEAGFNGSQIIIKGTVINGATPGNITLQWAQASSQANNTTITASSFMKATRYE